MTTNFTLSKDFPGAFLLSMDAIRQLHREVIAYSGKAATISVHLDGGRSTYSEDIEEVFADSFVGTSKIRSIAISSKNYDIPRTCDVTLRTTGLTISIIGDRAPVLAVETDIQNILSAHQFWYSPLAARWTRGPLLFLVALISFFLLFWLGTVAYMVMAVKEPSSESIQIAFFGCLFPAFLLATTLEKAMPPVVFDFGLSGRLASRRSKRLRYVFGVLGVGLALGVAGNYLTEWLRSSMGP